MDRRHKQLFGMGNELHKAMGQGHGREALGPVLKDLVAYTLEHFTAEEALMRSTGYPNLERHKETHDVLARQVNEPLLRFYASHLILPSTLSHFLTEWLKHHIQEVGVAFIT